MRVALAEGSEFSPGLEQLDEVGRVGMVDRRRRCGRHRTQHHTDSCEAVQKARISLCITGGERRDTGAGAGAIVPEDQRAAVPRRRADVGGRPDDSEPMPIEGERTHEEGSIAAAWASVGPRKPGVIASVRAQPPTRSLRSRTSTVRPARARRVAVTRPFTPAPTTTTSWFTMTFVVLRSAFVVLFRSTFVVRRSSFGTPFERPSI